MVQYMYHRTWLHDILCHKSKQLTNHCQMWIPAEPYFAHSNMRSTTSSKISESSLILEERKFTTKKGGFKDLSQITVFAILFTGKIALFGNTGATLNCGKSLFPNYNNYERLLVKSSENVGIEISAHHAFLE